MPDRYQELRDAIAAGPTKHRAVDDFGEPDYLDGVEAQFAVVAGENKIPVAYMFDKADALLCAAADPDTIAALLADYDRLQRELEFIAYANPSRWDADMRDQFQEWAQNRARAALADGEASNGS